MKKLSNLPLYILLKVKISESKWLLKFCKLVYYCKKRAPGSTKPSSANIFPLNMITEEAKKQQKDHLLLIQIYKHSKV